MAFKLDIDKKAAIFRKLASGTLYDVGVEFELDKHYKDSVGVRNKVYAIYREVLSNPEKFSVHPDTVSLVEEAVSNRKIIKSTPKLVETQDALKETDIKSLTLDSRDKAGRLIHKKLAYIDAHPKALMNESLVTLGKIFGILFDKAQIIQGQATEHVALMGKIDPNMSAEEAINTVMRMREVVSAEKYD